MARLRPADLEYVGVVPAELLDSRHPVWRSSHAAAAWFSAHDLAVPVFQHPLARSRHATAVYAWATATDILDRRNPADGVRRLTELGLPPRFTALERAAARRGHDLHEHDPRVT